MQEESSISNHNRTEKTRAALKTAMRKLVLENGYAAASTPAIVKEAGVTRGALYHHFKDKRELFSAIVNDDCKAVADQISIHHTGEKGTLEALKTGADRFITAMSENGRTRIILVEAPSVLGRDGLVEIDDNNSRGLLQEGLRAAMVDGNLTEMPLQPLTELLSAMFDNASLNIENGMEKKQVLAVVHRIIDGLRKA